MINVVTTKKNISCISYFDNEDGLFCYDEDNKSIKYKETWTMDYTLLNLFNKFGEE